MAAMALGACGDAPRADWRILLEEEREGTRYHVTVGEGTCRALRGRERFVVRRDDAPRQLELEPGGGAIRVEAVDGACVRYAEGCTERQAPLRRDLVVRLAAVEERCEPALCEEPSLACGGGDAGTADGGRHADGGLRDGGQEGDGGLEDGGADDGGAGDAATDACARVPLFPDGDGDGFGDDGSSSEMRCPEEGWVPNAEDCDDGDENVRPGADEACDAIDRDCDGAIDEGSVCAPCVRILQRGELYIACPDPLGWPDARDACRAIGRELVTVEDADEDDRLRQRMSVRLSVEEFWIGLGDLDGDGTYRWVRDDSEPGYLPWTAGSPDDPPPACVRSVSNTTPPGWRDRPCPDPFPYVCDGPG